MVALAVGLAVVVGISLGLLGGGGSILTVPLLVYVAGVEAKQAIAMSLLVVGVTSAVAAFAHARAARVRWRTGLLVGLAAMAGAFGGGTLARFIAGPVLLIGFAVIMIAAGISMLHGRAAAESTKRRLPIMGAMIQGLLIGLLSGLVGAGGGFLIVPALVLLGGLRMPVAVGTSLVVIAMQSFAGLAGHLAAEQIDWRLAGLVTCAAVAGSLIGGRLATRIDPDVLRKAFGWFVLLMAAVILGEELDPVLGICVAILTAAAAAETVVCGRYQICPARRVTALLRATARAD